MTDKGWQPPAAARFCARWRYSYVNHVIPVPWDSMVSFDEYNEWATSVQKSWETYVTSRTGWSPI